MRCRTGRWPSSARSSSASSRARPPAAGPRSARSWSASLGVLVACVAPPVAGADRRGAGRVRIARWRRHATGAPRARRVPARARDRATRRRACRRHPRRRSRRGAVRRAGAGPSRPVRRPRRRPPARPGRGLGRRRRPPAPARGGGAGGAARAGSHRSRASTNAGGGSTPSGPSTPPTCSVSHPPGRPSRGWPTTPGSWCSPVRSTSGRPIARCSPASSSVTPAACPRRSPSSSGPPASPT